MLHYMDVFIVAEAGLSECARDDVCGSDFGLWLAVWLAAPFLLPIWLATAIGATLGVISARTGAAYAAGWFMAIWALPILGSAAWMVRCIPHSPRSPRPCRAHTRP